MTDKATVGPGVRKSKPICFSVLTETNGKICYVILNKCTHVPGRVIIDKNKYICYHTICSGSLVLVLLAFKGDTILSFLRTNKIKKMKKIFFIITLMAAFVSCQKMKYGNIEERWYEPSRTYTMFMPVSTGKIVVMVPYTVYDNADWCILVKGVGEKGDTITRTYYVTPEAYDTLTIGKFICIDGNCDEDLNNTKKSQ